MKRKKILILSACTLHFLILAGKHRGKKKRSGNVPFIGLLAGGTALGYGLYRIFRKPKPFKPSQKNLNIFTCCESAQTTQSQKLGMKDLVRSVYEQNIPHETQLTITRTYGQEPVERFFSKGLTIKNYTGTIFICSRGYAKRQKPGTNDEFIQKGACITNACWQIRDNIISDGPIITFDYPDERDYFNFGQKLDVACLETVYQLVTQANPFASIVIVGDCRGARCALEFAITPRDQLKALVLISPFVSARQLTNQVSKNYLKWLPYSDAVLHKFFDIYFPSYIEQEDNLIEIVQDIPNDLPIFIGHRAFDTLVGDHQIMELVELLEKTGHSEVTFIRLNDKSAPHSMLTPVKEFQKHVNTFLKKHDFPHNPTL